MRFHWNPENVAHVARHDLTPADAEAIFSAEDFTARQSFPNGRWEGEGTVAGKPFRVVFTRPGPDEVLVITAFRVRRRRA